MMILLCYTADFLDKTTAYTIKGVLCMYVYNDCDDERLQTTLFLGLSNSMWALKDCATS